MGGDEGLRWHAQLGEEEGARRDRVTVYRFEGVDTTATALSTLAAHVGLAVDALAIGTGPYGKPFLLRSEWRFNLSHSRGVCLLAVSMGREVGIDVERIRPLRRRAALLARCFAPDEQARLASASDREFLRHWAAKEALVKAIGRGIAYGLKRIETARADDGTLSIARCDGPGGPAARWQLTELGDIDDAVAMLVQPAPALPVDCVFVGRPGSSR
jgi:4'-phosphopantetheinyl transferase